MATDTLDDDSFSDLLDQLFAQWRRKIETEFCVSCSAHVVKYDATTQRADVRLGRVPVTYEGEETVVGKPITLPGIRVVFPGSDDNYVSFPIVPGTTGNVFFSDRCLDLWHKRGVPVDPVNARAHVLADATFEPGLRHDKNVITPATDLTATVLHGALVKLGRGATEFSVLGNTLQTALTTFTSAVIAANTTWAGVPAAGPAFSTALGTALSTLLADLTNILSTKVQVQ